MTTPPLALVAPADVVESSRLEFLSLPPVWVIVLVLVPALIVTARWLYRRERLEGRLPLAPAILRGLSLALVILFLFHPVRSTQKMRVEKPVAALLLDDSASMRERDMGELATRLGLPREAPRHAVMAAALAEPLERLAADYEILPYAFGESLRAVEGPAELHAADAETRLGEALSSLAADTRGRELAQVVLVTDGRGNAGRGVEAVLASLPGGGVPVNTVGVGDPAVPRDVRLSQITAPEVALAGDTVTLEVAVSARGFMGEVTRLSITDARDDLELASVPVTLAAPEGVAPSEQTEQLVRISFVPEAEGNADLRIHIDGLPGEQDLANNTERRLLRVEPGNIKVLYVDGYPRYEYRFLKDSLLRVRNMQVQCFLVSASSDFIQESTEGLERLARIPHELDYLLENYHVIILGDVHPQDLGPHWETFLESVKGFVEAGGGFLMQAGTRHSPKEYLNTPIADILPVLIGEPGSEWHNVAGEGEAFRPVLSRPRDPHEIVTLDPDLDLNRELWEGDDGLAPLTWYHPVAKARSTAEVLLTHPSNANAHGAHVLLATMYHPQGRTAYLGTDETWRWRFRFLETYREPFWRGLIRHLALNRLRRSDFRFDLSTDLSSYDIGERVALTARVRGNEFEPLEAESFAVQVVAPDGARSDLELAREEAGVFTGSLLASEAGSWRLWLEDPEEPGGEPKSERIVTVTVPSTETDDAVLDDRLLREIAAATGGNYTPLADVDGLLSRLDDPRRERPLDEPVRDELWAGYPQLGLLVLLLGAEWFLRKKQNLV